MLYRYTVRRQPAVREKRERSGGTLRIVTAVTRRLWSLDIGKYEQKHWEVGDDMSDGPASASSAPTA